MQKIGEKQSIKLNLWHKYLNLYRIRTTNFYNYKYFKFLTNAGKKNLNIPFLQLLTHCNIYTIKKFRSLLNPFPLHILLNCMYHSERLDYRNFLSVVGILLFIFKLEKTIYIYILIHGFVKFENKRKNYDNIIHWFIHSKMDFAPFFFTLHLISSDRFGTIHELAWLYSFSSLYELITNKDYLFNWTNVR